jgi:Uma2 family endonuclease
MPTAPPSAKKYQERWREIVSDPHLRELPYTVETNDRGQILLGPHQADHSYLQGDVIGLLYERAGEGRPFPEFPITTDEGVKVPGVVWMTARRREEVDGTGDPPTLAPEICAEGMSESNDWDEMKAKIDLYREAGAEEVWVVEQDGRIRFFTNEEMEESALVPDVPTSV